MAGGKKKTLQKWMVHFLKESLTLLACVLFLFSVLFPFYHLTYVGMRLLPEYEKTFYSVDYWSFKVQYMYSHPGRLGIGFAEYWFYQPGFYEFVPGPRLSSVLLLVFVAQVFTLGTGIVSIFVRKRVLALAPVILSLEVALLMVFVNFVLFESNSSVDTYQTGYWLTYLSMFLFLLSSILNLVLNRRKKTESKKPEAT